MKAKYKGYFIGLVCGAISAAIYYEVFVLK